MIACGAHYGVARFGELDPFAVLGALLHAAVGVVIWCLGGFGDGAGVLAYMLGCPWGLVADAGDCAAWTCRECVALVGVVEGVWVHVCSAVSIGAVCAY